MAQRQYREDIQRKLEAIKDSAPIIEVIRGEILPYYKDDYWPNGLSELEYTSVCRCPLHNEQQGSFRIFPDTNTCNCYAGCGGGDSIWLYREFNKKILNRDVKFTEAVEYLWDKYINGQDVSKVTFTKQTGSEPLSTPIEALQFNLELVSNEKHLSSISDSEKLDTYYKIDTLSRLVSSNAMPATEAQQELKRTYTKIKSKGAIQQ